MNRRQVCLVAALLGATACAQNRDRDPDPYDIDFEIPRSENFAESLRAYEIYEEPLARLQPTPKAIGYELTSELFTDYALKQRLMIVPDQSSVTVGDDQTLEYPEGTILVKTFYYRADMGDTTSAVRVIETRLLVKTEGTWNTATYLWNDEQDDATLLLDGTTTDVSWIDEAGDERATEYAVPHEGECVTCHQMDGSSAFIGPTLRNLNRSVVRGDDVNQLTFLQAQGIFDETDELSSAPTVPNYKDTAMPLESRARAYLDINCAHCHSPGRWNEASQRDFDFRYGTPLSETGLQERERIVDALQSGEMPYLGTTLKHDDGVRLVVDYLDSL